MKAKSIKGKSAEEIQAALQQSMIDGFKPTLAVVFLSISQDRKAWITLVHGLVESVVPVLGAIEKRDANALLSGGHAINMACESCHQKYWYPNRVLQEEQQQQ